MRLIAFAGLLSMMFVTGCNRSSPELDLKPVFTNYQLDTSVFALAFEGDTVWVGTDRGLIQYDLVQDRILRQYDSRNGPEQGPISDVVTCVRIDAAGVKWIGTHGGGLSRFDGRTWTHYGTPELADPYVYDLVFAPDGRTWVANWRGVSIHDGRGWISYTTEDGIADDWVYALAQDHDGAMWLGTEGGVTRVMGKTFRSYSHADGLGAKADEVGPYDKIENPSFHHQTSPGKEAEGYNPNYILSAAVDPKNRKWFGTWGGGLAQFDGRRWRNFTTQDGLPGNFISDIQIERDGSLWIATDGGAGLLQRGRWRKFTTADGLIDDAVFTVAIDTRGAKWFGTLSGISKLEGFEPVSATH